MEQKTFKLFDKVFTFKEEYEADKDCNETFECEGCQTEYENDSCIFECPICSDVEVCDACGIQCFICDRLICKDCIEKITHEGETYNICPECKYEYENQ